MLKCFLLFLSGVLCIGSSLSAQQLKVASVERFAAYHQVSADTVVPSEMNSNVWLIATLEVNGGSITDLELSNDLAKIRIPSVAANRYEAGVAFESTAELIPLLQHAEYSFSGNGSTVGAFEIPFTMPETEFFDAKKVLNYDILQILDPSSPTVINWEPFTEAQTPAGGFIEVIVHYQDGNESVIVWESTVEQDGVRSRPSLSSTQVTMPPNVLRGSPNGVYTLSLSVSNLDSQIEGPDPFEDGVLATLVTVLTHLEITVKDDLETWAEWSDTDVDNWIDTQGFLGWIFVGENSWIAPQNKLGWIYLPEEDVTAGGAWTYLPR